MNSKYPLQNLENTAERQIFSFEEFSFDAEEKILWRGSEVIPIPPKTCELLAVFIENAGQILSKEDLMNLVWKDTFVEEANLSHHIAVLRKSLGEGKGGKKFIQTIPRKGYRFVAPVSETRKDALEMTVSERTTTELIEEIEIEGDNAPAQTIQPKLVPQNKISKPAKQFPKRAAIYFSLALLTIFGASAFFWFSSRSNANNEKIENPMTLARITNSGKVGASNISPDGKFVSYIQNYTDGIGAIYVRQTDTNIETRLAVREKGEFGTTAFSPDGAFVFYIARDAAHPDFGLYRVPILGGSSVRLVEKLDNNYFALSPEGSQTAVVRVDYEQKQSSLVLAKLDGSGAEQILTTRSFQEMSFGPAAAWSPDGRTIVLPVKTAALTKNYSQDVVGIMAFDLTSGEFKKFTEETWMNIGIMHWMPDGSGVVVIGNRPRLRNQIYFVSNPSGEVSRITNDTNGYGNYGLGITADGSAMVTDIWEFQGRLWMLEASGDTKTAVRLPAGDTSLSSGLTMLPGGQIIYSTRTNSNVDLWMLGADDTEAKPLTSDAFYDTGAVAAPDGSFIVFSSDREGTGTSHLFRMNTDGSQIRQLTFGEGLEDAPDISPDGNWIIYHSSEFDSAKSNSRNTIRKIPSGGGSPVGLFEECFAPAFSPDGQMFSCIAPTADNYRGKIAVVGADGGEAIKTFDVNYFYHIQLPARWTPDGTGLVFRHLENQTGNLWKQNLVGGSPINLTDFKSEVIFNFAFARDGISTSPSRATAKAFCFLAATQWLMS